MKIKSVILWILVIVWMIVIFTFSQNVAEESNSKSKRVAYEVVNIVEKEKTEKEKEKMAEELHIPFRKLAHGFEYCVLCILVLLALKSSNIADNKIYIIALIICIIYASTDEIHQLFISGRYGDFQDVLIDTAGSTIGMLLYIITNKIIKKIKS